MCKGKSFSKAAGEWTCVRNLRIKDLRRVGTEGASMTTWKITLVASLIGTAVGFWAWELDLTEWSGRNIRSLQAFCLPSLPSLLCNWSGQPTSSRHLPDFDSGGWPRSRAFRDLGKRDVSVRKSCYLSELRSISFVQLDWPLVLVADPCNFPGLEKRETWGTRL